MVNQAAIEKERLQQAALRRALAAKEAQTDVVKLCEITMPDPVEQEGTLYSAQPHHYLIRDVFKKVVDGEILNVILTIGPQFGKSKLCKALLAQHAGLFPWKHLIYCTYNQTFAEENGGDVRNLIESTPYQLAFPKVKLAKGSKAKDHMMVESYNGKLAFAGRGGGVSGKPADGIIFDDFFKNQDEANSLTIRNSVWEFLTGSVFARCHALTWKVIVSCMTGDTPVLLPDGTERRLDALRAGDVVATYDNGRLSSSSVVAWKSCGNDFILKITTSSGIVVRANGRHPFLATIDGELKWIRARSLTTAHKIVTLKGSTGSGKELNAALMDVKSRSAAVGCVLPTTTRKNGQTGIAHHLAIRMPGGLLASSIATVSLQTITLVSLLSKAVSALSAALVKRPRVGASDFVLTTAMKPAPLEGCSVTDAIYPSDTLELNEWHLPLPNTSGFTLEEIVSIQPDGNEEVFDVQIARTENFIANGLVSHNTRWDHDDPVGRLTDPTNPYYNKEVADQWLIINIPAIMENEHIAKSLGKKVGDALWPERFPLKLLNTSRAMNPRQFDSLYMGRPTPLEGAFFKRHQIHGYERGTVPKNTARYLSGDLAVSETVSADKTCIGAWEVDESGVLYLMPDIKWGKFDTGITIDWVIDKAKEITALTFYQEKGVISKATAPTLKKRMQEKKKYFGCEYLPVAGNKGWGASAIRDRMALGMVRFPKFAPWWPAAEQAILKFGEEGGPDDDFIDMMAVMGRAVNSHMKGRGDDNVVALIPKRGSPAWFRYCRNHEFAAEKKRKATAGW